MAPVAVKSAFLILFCGLFSALLSLAQDVKPPATVTAAREFFPTSGPEPSSPATATSTASSTTGPASPTTGATTERVVPSTTWRAPSTIDATTERVPSTIDATTEGVPSTINATTQHAPSTSNATTAPTPRSSTTAGPPPEPTPPDHLSAGDYRLLKNNSVCVMAHAALQIRLQTSKASGTFAVQPNKTRAVGECRENGANLTLVFPEGFVTFLFNKSTEENIGYVHTLTFRLVYPLSTASGQFSASNHSLRVLSAKIGHSYSCRSDSFYMGNGLYLDVKDDRVQAFDFSKSNEFGVPDLCAADRPDYGVAIGVGVTLLVLILAVVAIYLLGRRRRTDGYQAL
ncbi:macrosialin [Corythoichthys intestinalis]|uniref:macrosialin n=1 Tax=Corythoichthys intestinalis TaxID=161448 RepID=UPI0025A503F8|nr:macrosialin [Corythoichthys intestinalis]